MTLRYRTADPNCLGRPSSFLFFSRTANRTFQDGASPMFRHCLGNELPWPIKAMTESRLQFVFACTARLNAGSRDRVKHGCIGCSPDPCCLQYGDASCCFSSWAL